ncbi:MAG: hypothetical protein Athens041674_436 [Parcubacteria group bacterium Athens0416_74]|nr:MAG: hypothetical protein Athens041674_436 [Parcubacteria group bacterium Athens0416_74]
MRRDPKARGKIEPVEDSTADTGGYISSIGALERAMSLDSVVLALIQDVIKLECVSDGARKRLLAIVEKHSRTE